MLNAAKKKLQYISYLVCHNHKLGINRIVFIAVCVMCVEWCPIESTLTPHPIIWRPNLALAVPTGYIAFLKGNELHASPGMDYNAKN